MNVVHKAQELAMAGRPVCAAIGVFDGVHIGHQEVIRQTLADARATGGLAVVITFDCHPNSIVAPQRNPPLIYSIAKKLEVLASLGLDATLLLHFDRAFSRQTGEEFAIGLARDFKRLEGLFVGADFTFGYRRSGNLALLRQLGRELGFAVHEIVPVTQGSHVISSTLIRKSIRAGDFAAASRQLGRPYSLCGNVVRGDQLGRQMGFPTANLGVNGLALPPNGVYVAQALHQERRYSAVVNIGLRPTLDHPVPKLQVEAHLLGFKGDLYGAGLELFFVSKLRDERKFPSRDSLGAQISRDIAAAENILRELDPEP
ncbi:MAG: bifunctional riboflavin kinase/FAD synthetase [Candidatus Omnitrophica bacterium]|nr:bifunctional riboflavin kinase/FAD synthetase [Candidatus Omnitrophota bacterium]